LRWMFRLVTSVVRIGVDMIKLKSSKYFLLAAQDYADAVGDDYLFSKIYEQKREKYGVRESTWATLFFLYGAVIADDLEVL